MLNPQMYTDDRVTAAVYVLHNEGRPISKIAKSLRMPESEVRRRIVDVWLAHKMRLSGRPPETF